MKESIELKIPKDWSAISLKTYLQMNKDLKVYEDNEEAQRAVMLYHLCGVRVEWLKSISIDDYMHINSKLNSFLSQTQLPLQQIIKIGDEEYGFEPNLSKMAYGVYMDISAYDELAINDKWAEIMSILYRKVTKRKGKFYDIEEYNGKINAEPFLELGMDIHLGALFFLITLQMDLLKDIQKYLMEEVEIPHNIKSILERNGSPTHPLSHYQQIISSYLKKLKDSH